MARIAAGALIESRQLAVESNVVKRQVGVTDDGVAAEYTGGPQGLLMIGDVDDPHTAGPSGTDLIRRANFTWTVAGPADPDCQMTSLTFLGRIECASPFGQPAIPGVHRFRIVAGGPPAQPYDPCPALVFCNFPIFDTICVTGGEFILNPSGQDQCSVGVASQTWSQAKGLYR